MTKQNSPKFDLIKIDAVKAKQHTFYELSVNGVKPLQSFEIALKESAYEGELHAILAYMDYCSNGQFPPVSKMKDITPKKEAVKEYEFKSKHLRIYAIQQPGCKIVILCGYKNSQDSDISKFRSLKQQYLDSIK